MSRPGPGESDDSAATPLTAEEIAKNVHSVKSRMKRGRASRGGTASPTASPKKGPPGSAASKLMRKWGDSAVSNEDMAALDYSAPAPSSVNGGAAAANGDEKVDEAPPVDTDGMISSSAMGKRTANGYEIADWDYKGEEEELPTEDEILANGTSRLSLANDKEKDKEEVQAASVGGGMLGSMFARLTGKKVLTEEDLKPVLAEMERHLMSKNVAKDIAEKLCDGVGSALVGKKLGGLSSESVITLFASPTLLLVFWCFSLSFDCRHQV